MLVTRPQRLVERLSPIGSRTLDEATRKKVLLINEGGEPRTLDPHAGYSLQILSQPENR